MDVKETVLNIVKKYKTRNPYEIATHMDILITKCELGEIRGYYIHAYRIKQICLNCNLSKELETFVLAHEIGHSVLHPNANTPFLRAGTFLSVDKMEIEANLFAMELLISDAELKEYESSTIEQLSRIFGYHQNLIELKVENYKRYQKIISNYIL